MRRRLLILAQEPETEADYIRMAQDLQEIFQKNCDVQLHILESGDIVKEGIRKVKEFGACDCILLFAGSILPWGKLGTKAKKMTGAKLVYDIHSLELERKVALEEIYGDSLQTALELKKEKEFLSFADLLVVHDRTVLAELEEKMGDSLPECKIVREWIHTGDLSILEEDDRQVERFKDEQLCTERFVYLYNGELNASEGIWNLVKAAELCYEKEDLLFLLTGRIRQRQMDQVEEYCRLRFLEKQVQIYENLEPLEVVVNAADIVLVCETKPVVGYSTTEQILHAMAVAKPVLGILDPESEEAKLILRSGCGIVCAPDSLTDIRLAVVRFYQMRNSDNLIRMGIRGRNYLTKELSRKEGARAYAGEIKRQILIKARAEEEKLAMIEMKKREKEERKLRKGRSGKKEEVKN